MLTGNFTCIVKTVTYDRKKLGFGEGRTREKSVDSVSASESVTTQNLLPTARDPI